MKSDTPPIAVVRVAESITLLCVAIHQTPPEDRDLVASMLDGFAAATLMRGDIGEDAVLLAAERLKACAEVFRHEAEVQRRVATDVRSLINDINDILDEHDGGQP